jgi:hypothetical protein
VLCAALTTWLASRAFRLGMLRYGQLSGDEYFVSAGAAQQGVTIVNRSPWEPLVVLKHFGPNHPQMPKAPAD